MNTLYDKTIEQKVLGQIIIEPDAFLRVSEILNATDFYDQGYCEVYEAIQSVFKDNRGIDVLTVVNELKKAKSNVSAFDVSKLTEGVASASHLEYHARIIKDYSVRRKMLKELARLQEIGQSLENNLDEFIDKASLFVDKVLNEVDNRSEIRKFGDNVSESLEYIQETQKGNKAASGVKPSLSAIRTFAPLWGNGDLIVLAARPGMGKTALGIHELFHIAKNDGPVLYFSLEMSRRQITDRILQAESGLTRYDFDRMDPEKWVKLDNAASAIIDYNFFIDDTPSISISHIKAKGKIFKKQHDIKAIVIDYIGLMTADKRLSREQQVSEISRNLKGIAKELDIPIFEISQLNRGPENRKEDAFRPKLSDLRDSGALEQDADMVIFPHRPSYYMPDEPEYEGKAELIFAKNRQGNTGIATVKVNETITKFYDIIHGAPDDFQRVPY